MAPNIQLRIRLSNAAAHRFLTLPPRARSRAISFLVNSTSEGIDLTCLLQARRELTALGVLINQSLRTSWGKTTNAEALHKLLKKLQKILA